MLYNISTLERVRNRVIDGTDREVTRTARPAMKTVATRRAEYSMKYLRKMRYVEYHPINRNFLDVYVSLTRDQRISLLNKEFDERVVPQDTNVLDNPQWLGFELESALCSRTEDEVTEASDTLAEIISDESTARYNVTTDGSLHSSIGYEFVTCKATYTALHETIKQLVATWTPFTHNDPSYALGCINVGDTRIQSSVGEVATGGEEAGRGWYGMHCHVGLDEMDARSRQRLWVLLNAAFCNLEFVARSIGGRPQTNWDKQAKTASIKSIERLWGGRTAVALRSEKPTIEFRFGASRMDYTHCITYVQFCHALTAWAKLVLSEDDLLCYIMRPSAGTQISHELRSCFSTHEYALLRVYNKQNAYDMKYLTNASFFDFVLQEDGYHELKTALDSLYTLPKAKHLLRHKDYDNSTQFAEVQHETA